MSADKRSFVNFSRMRASHKLHLISTRAIRPALTLPLSFLLFECFQIKVTFVVLSVCVFLCSLSLHAQLLSPADFKQTQTAGCATSSTMARPVFGFACVALLLCAVKVWETSSGLQPSSKRNLIAMASNLIAMASPPNVMSVLFECPKNSEEIVES